MSGLEFYFKVILFQGYFISGLHRTEESLPSQSLHVPKPVHFIGWKHFLVIVGSAIQSVLLCAININR